MVTHINSIPAAIVIGTIKGVAGGMICDVLCHTDDITKRNICFNNNTC